MKKKIISIFLITAMLLSILPLTAYAATKTFQGVEIGYGGAAIVNFFTFEADGFITFRYTGSSTLEIPEGYKAIADILVVGGGGSGSSGGKNSSKQGYGGKGGEVVIRENVELAAGKYIVAVGSGGDSVTGKINSRTSGQNGYDSYVEGPNDFKITALKGSAGSASGVSGAGTVSDITGTSVTYGADGASRTSSGEASVSGDDNTGNGGSGGYSGAKSGAGGRGVVIIRITDIVPLHAPEIAYTIVIPTEISVNKKGVTAIGKPTVKDVENADGKIITYTAEGTDFIKSDDDEKTVKAAYYTAYTDADNNTQLGSGSFTVYDGGYVSEEALTALYVFISDEEWENAENGTYHATVTYNFEAKEKPKLIVDPEDERSYAAKSTEWGPLTNVSGTPLFSQDKTNDGNNKFRIILSLTEDELDAGPLKIVYKKSDGSSEPATVTVDCAFSFFYGGEKKYEAGRDGFEDYAAFAVIEAEDLDKSSDYKVYRDSSDTETNLIGEITFIRE